MTSTLTKWYEEHGRHEIFAGGKNVGLEKESSYDLVLNDLTSSPRQRYVRQERHRQKTHAKRRFALATEAEDRRRNSKMAALYRKEVLGERLRKAGSFRSARSADWVELRPLEGQRRSGQCDRKRRFSGD